MSVIYNQNFCQPFYNGYRPLNVMRNGRKIAGWSNKSKGGENNSITLTGTYDDKLDFSIHGKTKLDIPPCIGTWNQSVINPLPCSDRTNDITRRLGKGVLTFLEDELKVENDDTCEAYFSVNLGSEVVRGHTYLIGIYYRMAVFEGTTHFTAGFNSVDTMHPNYGGRLGLVYRAGQYDEGETRIFFTLKGSLPSGELIYIKRFICVDLTALWGDENVQLPNYYNYDYNNMYYLFAHLEEVDPTSTATTDTIVPDVESPYFSGNPTPNNPCNVVPDEVFIETTSRITRNDLYSWDTLYSGGYIVSYGKVVQIGDLTWTYNNNNIFLWNGTNEIYRPEEVYMNSYKKVDTFNDLANESYAYFVNSNKMVFIKDKDYTDATNFKNDRADALIYYYSSTSSRREVEVEKPNTTPYTTTVTSNTSYTVTYKKWDNSAND